jgi:ATP-dependent RNA helicase DDX54/DBP10
VGADNVKMVKTESGTKLPTTYRSGRFDEWKAKTRVSLPKIGEAESVGVRNALSSRSRFKHHKVVTPKPLDKLSHDYGRKLRHIKKRAGGEDASAVDSSSKSHGPARKSGKRFGGKSIARVKTELKTTEQIRKGRQMLQKRRAKNARPSRKKGRR